MSGRALVVVVAVAFWSGLSTGAKAEGQTCRISTSVDRSTGRLVARSKCYGTRAERPSSVTSKASSARGAAKRAATATTNLSSGRATAGGTSSPAKAGRSKASSSTRSSGASRAVTNVTRRPPTTVPLGKGTYRYENGRLYYYPTVIDRSRYQAQGPIPATVRTTTAAAPRTSSTRTTAPRTPSRPVAPTQPTPLPPVIDPFVLASETLEQHPLPEPTAHIPPFQAIAGVPLILDIRDATEPTFQLLAATDEPITYACNPSSFDVDWGDGETTSTVNRSGHMHIWQNRGMASLAITANWTCEFRIESTQTIGTLTTSTGSTQPIPVREVQPVLIDQSA